MIAPHRYGAQVFWLLFFAAIPALVSGFVCSQTSKWDGFRDHMVLVSDVALWKKPVIWVDTRPATNFSTAHIPGALRLTGDDWNELLPGLLQDWSPESAVVVYCDSPKFQASEEVARRLRKEAGLKSVHVLRGGWNGWKAAHP